MSRSSPVPMLEPNDPPPFINEGVAAPEPLYPGDPQMNRSQTSLNRSRTSLQQSTGSLHQLQPADTKADEKKEKKDKDGGGSLGKLKGKFFKKKAKATEAPKSEFAEGIDNTEAQYDTMPESPNPYATFVPAPPSSAAAPPPPVLPSYPTRNMDVMEMKPAPPKSLCRSSIILNVLLITGFVVGLILCACIPADSNLVYIGPVILGLSLFAFCGKIFFTMFWQDDPLPESLKPYMAYLDKVYLGADPDPYGLKKSSTSTAAYVGPFATSGAKPGGTEMRPIAYSIRPPPVMYDESIDTRLRPATGASGYSTTPFTSGAPYGINPPQYGQSTPQYGGNTPQYGGNTPQYGRSTPQQHGGSTGHLAAASPHYDTVPDPYAPGADRQFFTSDIPAGASTPTRMT